MVDLWGMSAQMCVQSFVALRCILRKPLVFFGELTPTTRTTRMVFWDTPSGSKNRNSNYKLHPSGFDAIEDSKGIRPVKVT